MALQVCPVCRGKGYVYTRAGRRKCQACISTGNSHISQLGYVMRNLRDHEEKSPDRV